MSRESKRDRERLERQHDAAGGAGGSGAPDPPTAASGGTPGKRKGEGRASPGQYVGEVRSELRRVHWPDRKQLTQYSLVVLVMVTIMTAYIFAIDQVFGQFVLWVFG